jgi:integrase
MAEEKRIRVWVQAFPDRPHLVLQWHDPITGKRKSKSAGTADEKIAEDKRADLESDLNAGRHKEASSISWARFRELFEAEYLPNVRSSTGGVYRQVFNLFEEVMTPIPPRNITERTLSRFVAELRKKPTRNGVGFNPSTIRRTMQFLRSALLWCVRQKLLTSCPDFPAINVLKKSPRPVPEESFERLLAKAPDEQTRTFLLVAWLGGLRLAEVHSLRWEESEEYPWVDFDRDRIVLPAEFVKGQCDQWVPIDPTLREALLELPRQGPRIFRFLASDGHEVSTSTMSQRIIRLARAAGVKLSMHTLRKGFGCRYAGRVPAQVLQKLMRHADIKTTVAYYTNVDDAVEAAVFGDRRNTSRNKSDGNNPRPSSPLDANPYQS